ncbi:MAG: carboxypeptidase regulatory-like domain-containing protein [Deltaproteobacteria bacterium]|nr:carboxypeptidase regulatory-like domain-containing protein [Deltaproteobacteria bacterium]
MRALMVLLVLVVMGSESALAAQIYGSLVQNGKPVPGIEVYVVDCAGCQAKTDAYGSYRIYIPTSGKFTLKVRYGSGELSHLIYSYNNPVRYDFELVNQAGQYVLRRR